MDPDQQLRNVSSRIYIYFQQLNVIMILSYFFVMQLRDFLMVYNRMTEICFQRCSSNFNYRNLTMDEVTMSHSCIFICYSFDSLINTFPNCMSFLFCQKKKCTHKHACQYAAFAVIGFKLTSLFSSHLNVCHYNSKTNFGLISMFHEHYNVLMS